jgi:glycosyltransferase involved in cell wall biosynthesis
VHVLDGDFASGYFPDLARFADGERYETVFTSLDGLPEDRVALLTVPGVSRYVPLDAATNFGGQATGLLGRGRWAAATELRLARFVSRIRPDIVHAHLYLPALLGTLAAALRGVPARVVGRHHSDLLHRAARPIHVRADQLATRLSNAVITNSEFTRAVMVEREAAPPDKVHVVYYGLDTKSLVPAAAERLETLRVELGLTGDRLVVLVPARLDREKGHEHLFDALARLGRDNARAFHVLVAGEGPDREHFERRVEELGIQEHVSFLGHRRDLPLVYQVADLTVLPSLSEAFGQVLIESLCFGTAVVATRVGGIPEIVEDGRTGLLVAPANSGDLACALRASAEQPERRAAMARAGQTHVREAFDSRRTARNNEAVYENLLARAGGGAA